jgi:hypothetical protein
LVDLLTCVGFWPGSQSPLRVPSTGDRSKSLCYAAQQDNRTGVLSGACQG